MKKFTAYVAITFAAAVFSTTAFADKIQEAVDWTTENGVSVGTRPASTGPRTTETVPMVTGTWTYGPNGIRRGQPVPTRSSGSSGGSGLDEFIKDQAQY